MVAGLQEHRWSQYTSYSRTTWLTRVCQFAGKHISPRLIHQGEQISPGAWLGICVRGNRKSGGTHISATAAIDDPPEDRRAASVPKSAYLRRFTCPLNNAHLEEAATVRLLLSLRTLQDRRFQLSNLGYFKTLIFCIIQCLSDKYLLCRK